MDNTNKITFWVTNQEILCKKYKVQYFNTKKNVHTLRLSIKDLKVIKDNIWLLAMHLLSVNIFGFPLTGNIVAQEYKNPLTATVSPTHVHMLIWALNTP